MPKTKVKIKTKRGRGGQRLTKIKAKIKKDAYLGGEISREVSDIVCKLSCPHCGGA